MKRFFTLTFVLILVVMSIGAAGCSSGDSEHNASSSLPGTSWRLTSFGAGFWQIPLVPLTKITLTFDAGAEHFSGNASMNSYGGDCEIQNNGISISQIYQTQLGSPDPSGIMQQESDYLTLLAASKSFAISKNSLTIYCSDGQVLIFERNDLIAKKLAGTSWRLTSFGAGFWQIPLVPLTKIMLTFDAGAAVARGKAGVNLYGFDYVLTADKITVLRVTSTDMSGIFPVIQQENRYLKMLAASESVAVSENRLTIYCSGSDALRFRKD